ncbi:hypothetical protein D6T65_15745 [Arthrobacter frigidicola]|nr:hypothetical protein D6T65_15745 [Arthrobacter frigidicola]
MTLAEIWRSDVLRTHHAPRRLTAVCVLTALLAGCAPEASEVPTAARVALINHSSPADDYFNGHFCGAALVKPDIVATASHCIEGKRAELIDVVVGADNLCNNAPVHGERLPVVEVVTQAPPLHEMSLLRLKRPSSARPLALSDPGTASDKLFAVGWGRLSTAGVSPCEIKGSEQVQIDPGHCADYFRALGLDETDRPFFTCAEPAESAKHNTCQGDSGGPILRMAADAWELHGITLGGSSCSVEASGIYISSRSIADALEAGFSNAR